MKKALENALKLKTKGWRRKKKKLATVTVLLQWQSLDKVGLCTVHGF